MSVARVLKFWFQLLLGLRGTLLCAYPPSPLDPLVAFLSFWCLPVLHSHGLISEARPLTKPGKGGSPSEQSPLGMEQEPLVTLSLLLS